MNDIRNKESIENAFKKEDYKLLIVANKYQTGFDEPLLYTMYIDKMLNNVKAVQTLNRINRIHKNKNNTLILDFANKTDVIQKSFQPYYESTYLKEGTDPHKLYDLWDNLMDYELFEWDAVEKFVNAYKTGKSQVILHNILNPIIIEFKKMNEEKQFEFKKTLRSYQNMYSFLS